MYKEQGCNITALFLQKEKALHKAAPGIKII